MTDLIRAGYMCEASANWSRWVAECGRCPRAIQLQRFTSYFECDFCGAVTDILWPSLEMMEAVERLLMMRPDPSTRNWLPGETLHDLMFENGAHGIFDNLEEAPGQVLLSVGDDRINLDRLPQLKARVRREIT